MSEVIKISCFKFNNLIFIALVIIISTISFYHGWYLDTSKPVSGFGWTDQTYYLKVTEKLYFRDPLLRSDFHYQMGYSILGVIAYGIYPQDPFLLVSYALFITSLIFAFYGASVYLNKAQLLIFIALIVFRWGDVRELNYWQEVFLIPWNNQVILFIFCVHFYFFSQIDSQKNISSYSLLLLSVFTGYAITTRLEVLIFLIPMYLFILLKLIKIKSYLFVSCIALLMIGMAPHFIVQYLSLGDIVSNPRPSDFGLSYFDKLKHYIDYDRFMPNILNVIYDSSFSGYENINRLSLLDASPWFYLSPIGMVLIIARKNLLGLKFFIMFSFLFLLFYMLGENMSAHKLKFHCLRYIAPVFLTLTLLSVYPLQLLAYFSKGKECKN
jgi:hypothetical protein